MPFMHGDPNLGGVGTPIGGNASQTGYTNAAQQWLRACSLVVGDDAEGIELAGPDKDQVLRIRFAVSYFSTPTPATFHARIYNLSKPTIQRLIGLATKGPSTVNSVSPSGVPSALVFPSSAACCLRAGYQQNFATVFKGQIYQMRVGKERNVDSYLDIFAADGDLYHAHAVVNQTFAAGYKSQDVWEAAGKAGKALGVTTGPAPAGMSQAASPRGKAVFAMARDVLSDLGTTHGFNWNVSGMQLKALPKFGFDPGSLIVVNSQNGMIGVPEQTESGIKLECLMNPAIRWGTQIKINNSDIERYLLLQQGLTVPKEDGASAPLPPLNKAGKNLDDPAEIAAGSGTGPDYDPSADGHYVVLSVEHIGDTRGNEWFSRCVCLTTDITAVLPKDGGVLPPPFPQ